MRIRSWWRKQEWWDLLLLIFLLRLVYLPLFCAVTDLAGDESYYWEWGRRPDWGYYSKPPMIGWLMGVAGYLSDHAEWAVRLSALLFGTASLAMLAALSQAVSGFRAAKLTLLLAALTPANVALNLFFTIDAPLVFFWSAALLLFWLAIHHPTKVLYWALLAVTLGLGNLSKQMMLVFPVLMLLLISTQSQLRHLLKNVGLWLCLVLPLAFMLPVLWWNQQHAWITIEHTREHFQTSSHASLLKHLGETLVFPLTQAGLFTPIIYGLLIYALIHVLLRWPRATVKHRYLVTFSLPGLVIFFLLSLRQGINPNWPAVYYLSAFVLLGGLLAGSPSWITPTFLKRWLKPAFTTAVVMTVAAMIMPVAFAHLPEHLAKYDPAERLRGWRQAGELMGAYIEKTSRPGSTFLLALGHRENASQFAFYTPQHPRVYRWEPNGKIASQYELWPSASEQAGNDALIIQPPEKSLPKRLTKAFEKVVPYGEVVVTLPGGKTRSWTVWLGVKLKHWPLDHLNKKQQDLSQVIADHK